MADFGIARITTGATIAVQDTQTGSVHYISPEQARGNVGDEKSDLYSLGITMYEMSTGTLPFDADTAVSVAIKHIHDEIKAPSALNTEISTSLEQIIIKSTLKKPNLRYQSAEELLKDIKKAQDFPDDDFVEINSYEDHSPTIDMTKDQLDEIRNRSKTIELDKDRKIDRLVILTAAIAGIAIAVIVVLIGWNMFNPTAKSFEVQIPNVEGQSLENAMAAFIAKDITYNIVSNEYSDTYEANYVIAQTPNGLVLVEDGNKAQVDIILSKGMETFTVPDVIGYSYEEAEKMLEEAGFLVSRTTSNNDFIPLGEIITQQPAGNSKLQKGSIIELSVSLGPAPKMTNMPDVIGFSEEEGKSKIQDAELTVGNITYVRHETVEKGFIITTSVDTGDELEVGYKVNLVVSDGKPITSKKLTVPDQLSNNNKTIGILKVIMIVEESEFVVYEETVTVSSFPVDLTIQGESEARVQVFLDDSLQYETMVYFE